MDDGRCSQGRGLMGGEEKRLQVTRLRCTLEEDAKDKADWPAALRLLDQLKYLPRALP